MKRSTAYFCTECGYESPKWAGQCPACKAWNTLVEEPTAPKEKLRAKSQTAHAVNLKPVDLREIDATAECRIDTGFSELNRVLGGGTVEGSLVLIGGDPGIGKSTILLQVCRNFAVLGKRVLYISGEESLRQIKLRAERLRALEGDLRFLSETNLDSIREALLREKPDIAIIDSIQTMYCDDISAAPGSVSQVRESTNALMQLAKGSGVAIFIVGHVTKEGQVAGPRVLEHMVDTVLYFEGERSASYRILRGVKNRFGSTNEIGVFEMLPQGLGEVINPSEYLLSGRPEGASGAAVACLMEGTRPILLEVQALVTETAFGLPRRTAVGTDVNRVNLLMAVIEKRCRIMMNRYDAYINIAGGLRVGEPALDLAIVLALISSVKDRALDDSMVVFGEVGLAGEVRSVAMAEYRVREAEKLGFSRCILPKVCLDKLNYRGKMEIVGVRSIQDAINLL